MIKLIYERGPFGDEICNYTVETDAKYVVEFIEQVLKERPQEWGYVIIRDQDTDTDVCVCAYNHGEIERRASNYDSYGIFVIESIFANGGWWAMDYDIKVKKNIPLPEQSHDEFQEVYFGWKKK